MLIQYTPVSALDQNARARLAAALTGLLQTTEAARGYVMFEGRYFAVSDLQSIGRGPQMLQEIL